MLHAARTTVCISAWLCFTSLGHLLRFPNWGLQISFCFFGEMQLGGGRDALMSVFAWAVWCCTEQHPAPANIWRQNYPKCLCASLPIATAPALFLLLLWGGKGKAKTWCHSKGTGPRASLHPFSNKGVTCQDEPNGTKAAAAAILPISLTLLFKEGSISLFVKAHLWTPRSPLL